MNRFKQWRYRRRLDKAIAQTGFPAEYRVIFTGNVRIREATYDPSPETIKFLYEAWAKGDEA